MLPHRMARLLRLLRNSVGVARTRRVDQAAAARHRLEAMEAWTHSLCRAATPRRRPGPGGANRRQPTWPLAAQQQPRAHHCSAKRLLRLTRLGFRRGHRDPHNPPNRRIRTRTSGGVGGEEPRGSPLSRLTIECYSSLRAKRSNPSCRTGRMDCFVACAPRNDERGPTSPPARSCRATFRFPAAHAHASDWRR